MIDLEAIQDRLAAITPGPWKQRSKGIWTKYGCKIATIVGAPQLPQGIEHLGMHANADFFTHAPEDIRDLLAIATAARAWRTARETQTGIDAAETALLTAVAATND